MNYKYRVHDPRLGRFLSIDPLAPKYPFYSPYAFSGNRVIDAVELEGLEFYPLSSPATAKAFMDTEIELLDHEKLKFKLTNPTASYFEVHMKASGKLILGRAHLMLDGIGMIPVFGEPADVINGGLYTLEGEGVDASLSFAGAAPLVGWAATTGKWAKRALKFSDGAFHSASGLAFRLGGKHGNRLSHVFAHTSDDLTKKYHGVFDVGDELVATLDEAWEMAQKGGDNVVKTVQKDGNINYVVDLGRKVGYQGGKKGTGEALNKVKIAVYEGTSDVITAFPY